MVLSNASAGSLRGKQSVLFKVNEAGTDNMLRNGALGRVQSFMVGESNQAQAHTKGTGTSYTSSTAGFAVGVTDIALITGSGTVLAGDTITFTGDTNKYVVTTGVAAPGTITIAEPGLREAIAASAVAMTIGASSTEQNLAFDRNAIVLASRLPALPDGGDDAEDRTIVTDPFSGLSFEVAVYRQFRQLTYFVGIAWGVKMVKPAHSIILLS
ncbi:P22 coat - protein 5 family protein, partial [bacterium]|nr:P22 coat - protein 5 family protein [bacterium]